MIVGVWIPCYKRWVGREAVRCLGTEAEQLGFGSLWVQDHLVAPIGSADEQPVDLLPGWLEPDDYGNQRFSAPVEYYGEENWWLDPYVVWGFLARPDRAMRVGQRRGGRALPSPDRPSQDARNPRRALRRAHAVRRGRRARRGRVPVRGRRLRPPGRDHRRVPPRYDGRSSTAKKRTSTAPRPRSVRYERSFRLRAVVGRPSSSAVRASGQCDGQSSSATAGSLLMSDPSGSLPVLTTSRSRLPRPYVDAARVRRRSVGNERAVGAAPERPAPHVSLNRGDSRPHCRIRRPWSGPPRHRRPKPEPRSHARAVRACRTQRAR